MDVPTQVRREELIQEVVFIEGEIKPSSDLPHQNELDGRNPANEQAAQTHPVAAPNKHASCQVSQTVLRHSQSPKIDVASSRSPMTRQLPSPATSPIHRSSSHSSVVAERVDSTKADIIQKNMELKKQITKLKAEVEVEKSKAKQLHRDKITEMKQLKETYTQDKEHALMMLQTKFEQSRKSDSQHQREMINKEQDQYMRQVWRQHEDQLKQLTEQLNAEKEEAIKVALDLQNKTVPQQKDVPLSNNSYSRPSSNSAIIVKLQREIISLKDDKRQLDKQCHLKCMSEAEKSEEIQHMKQELEEFKEKVQTFTERKEWTHNDSAFKPFNLWKESDQSVLDSTFDNEYLQRSSEIDGTEADVAAEQSNSEHVEERIVEGHDEDNLQNSLLHTKHQVSDERDREKERHLQKKVNDLTGQVTRLDKRITFLKQENLVLKQKTDEQKPSEEKIKKLKKRNAELAAIARRLEEKAKQLQKENSKRLHTAASPSTQDVEQVKRAFAKQRAKDLAEQAKNTMAKDREIEQLRQKCQQLKEKLSDNLSPSHVENPGLYESNVELEGLIKQAARDRLRLEREFSNIKNHPTVDNVDPELVERLRAEKEELQTELLRIQNTMQHAHDLERTLVERTTECADLYRQMDEQRQLQTNLADELHEMITKNSDLTTQNTNLHEQLTHVDQLSRECEQHKLSLSAVEEQCCQVEAEKLSLKQQIEDLKQQTREMKNLEEQRKQLEQEQRTTLEQLKQKQQEIDKLTQIKDNEQKDNEELIVELQAKLRKLERKYELQALQHEEITVEMEEMRKEAEIAKFRPLMQSIDVQTDKSKSATSSPRSPRSTGGAAINDSFPALTDRRREDVSAKLSQKLNKMEHDFTEGLLMKKKPFQVYVAKYNYDPEQYSPNENPDAELILLTGDYIFVYGDVDEDGFFEGETMDGRRGLVPSNFVEKVPDKDLEDFHATIGLAGPSVGNASLQQELDFDSSQESDKVDSLSDERHITQGHDFEFDKRGQDTHVMASVTFGELDGSSQDVPSPQKLQLERQLHNSVLISWCPPENTTPAQIQAYHIFVDGQFSMAVKSTDRTKALIEGIQSNKVHCVCVRTISPSGHSADEQCTIVFGKDAPLKPSDLKVSNITASSAVVSWFPSNSNLEHRISVGNQNSAVLRPGVYRCLLSGLVHGCDHRVTVTTGADQQPNSNITAMTTLHTLNGGVPDAPIDVQVEAGPQKGSLLVTWLPVTITTTGMSNGAFVTGYNLYVDGEMLKCLDSPTGDHVILETSDIYTVGTDRCSLTVRTQAIDQESTDSQPIKLTADLLKEVLPANKPKLDLMNKLEPQDSGTELSDIAEVEEEDDKTNLRTAHKLRQENLSDGVSGQTNGVGRTNHRHHTPQSSPPRNVVSYMSRQQVGRDDPITSADQSQAAYNPQGSKQELLGRAGRMTVPHIEITKDSSGSFSDVNNLSEEEPNGPTSPRQITPSVVSDSHYDRREQTSPLQEQQQMRHGRSYHDDTDLHYDDGADIHSYYEQPSSRDSVRQKEKEYNEKNVAKTNELYHEQDGEYGRNNNKHDREHHHRASSAKDQSPHSAQRSSQIADDSSLKQDKRKRDYFDKRTKVTQYDEDSYSQLEDNNVLTSKVIRDDIPLSELIDYEDDGGESLMESVEMEYDENQVRIFIALFDYDPAIMSPNPDAIDEELCFKEGQLIKVYGEKDPDGFFVGESQGRRGFVPCNMVSEVEVDDPDVADQLLKESGRSLSRASKSTSRGTTPGAPTSNSRPTSQSHITTPRRHSHSAHDRGASPKTNLPPLPPEGPIKQMISLYPYDPHALSPNVDSELELAFVAGDHITVYGDMDDDGFYYGELNGHRGLVPSNFLEEIPPGHSRDHQGGQHSHHQQPDGHPHHQQPDGHPHHQQPDGHPHPAGHNNHHEKPAHSDHHNNKSSHNDGDMAADKNRNDKVVTFVPPKQQRPSPPVPSQPTQPTQVSAVTFSPNIVESNTAKHEPSKPAQRQSMLDSPPHNILNLDINNVKEKKKGFFSRGIFKKMGK